MNGTNQLAIQGVDYPADITGFLEGGSPIGVAVMCVTLLSLSLAFTDISRAKLINHTLAACPNTPLLLSGYSQGAQLVHQAAAAAALPANTTAKISSVVLFGDPKNGTAIQGIAEDKVLMICHTGMLALLNNPTK
jgi:cutinase